MRLRSAQALGDGDRLVSLGKCAQARAEFLLVIVKVRASISTARSGLQVANANLAAANAVVHAALDR